MLAHGRLRPIAIASADSIDNREMILRRLLDIRVAEKVREMNPECGRLKAEPDVRQKNVAAQFDDVIVKPDVELDERTAVRRVNGEFTQISGDLLRRWTELAETLGGATGGQSLQNLDEIEVAFQSLPGQALDDGAAIAFDRYEAVGGEAARQSLRRSGH